MAHDISLASSYYVKYRVWACMCVCVCAFSPGEDVLVQEQACFSLEMKYLPDNSIFTGAQPARQGHNTHPQIHKYLHTHIYTYEHIHWKVIFHRAVLAERKLQFLEKLTIRQKENCHSSQSYIFCREKTAIRGKGKIFFKRERCPSKQY